MRVCAGGTIVRGGRPSLRKRKRPPVLSVPPQQSITQTIPTPKHLHKHISLSLPSLFVLPMVRSCTGWKRRSVYMSSRHDLPTPAAVVVWLCRWISGSVLGVGYKGVAMHGWCSACVCSPFLPHPNKKRPQGNRPPRPTPPHTAHHKKNHAPESPMTMFLKR